MFPSPPFVVTIAQSPSSSSNTSWRVAIFWIPLKTQTGCCRVTANQGFWYLYFSDAPNSISCGDVESSSSKHRLDNATVILAIISLNAITSNAAIWRTPDSSAKITFRAFSTMSSWQLLFEVYNGERIGSRQIFVVGGNIWWNVTNALVIFPGCCTKPFRRTILFANTIKHIPKFRISCMILVVFNLSVFSLSLPSKRSNSSSGSPSSSGWSIHFST